MSRVILTAEQWHERLRREERAEKRSKANHEKQKRVELSVMDLRDETLSIVTNVYGKGEQAYEKVHASAGAHPSTLKAWAEGRVQRPQMPTLRATLRACGYDLVIRQIGEQ